MDRRRPRVLALALALSVLVGACSQPTPTTSSTPTRLPVVCAPGSIGWTIVGSLVQARKGHAATILADGRVLIVGGDDGAHVLNSAEVFDPGTRQWTATGSMTVPRLFPTATLLRDGRVLVAATSSGSGADTAEVFDPKEGTWTVAEPLIYGRIGQTATLLPDGSVLLVGGLGGSGGTVAGISKPKPAEIYDPATGQWTRTGQMRFNRFGHTATLLADGRVLVAGGQSLQGGQARADAEVYDPNGDTWTAVDDMPTARLRHAAIALPDGSTIVAGGQTRDGELITSIERFDPASRSWAAAGSLEGFTSGAAALLCDGTVVFAGGQLAQIYDPATELVTASRQLTPGHLDATLTSLQDGGALIAGGQAEDGAVIGAAEIFGPAP
jgi:hypothetical protein